MDATRIGCYLPIIQVTLAFVAGAIAANDEKMIEKPILGADLIEVRESAPIAFTLEDPNYLGTSQLWFSPNGKKLSCAFTERNGPGTWWIWDLVARKKQA